MKNRWLASLDSYGNAMRERDYASARVGFWPSLDPWADVVRHYTAIINRERNNINEIVWW